MPWTSPGSRRRARADRPRSKRYEVRPLVQPLEPRQLLAVGAGIAEYPTTAALSQPIDAVAGPDGNLWVTEYSARMLAVVSSTGAVVRTVPVAQHPYGIAAGPDGDLWFTENGPTPMVGHVHDDGSGLTEYPLPAGANPHGIAAGPDGNLWFAEYGLSRVGQITPGGTIQQFALSANSRPEDIAAGPDGSLWVTETAGNRIARVSTTGAITEFALPSPFSVPYDITAGPDGNLWVTEAGKARIGRITTLGQITEFAVSGPSYVRPTDIVTGPDGNLWWTDSSGNTLNQFTVDGPGPAEPVPTPNSSPTGIAVGPDGSLWATEATAGQLARLPWLTSGTVPTPDPQQAPYQGFATGNVGPLDGDQQTVIPIDPGCGCGCGTDNDESVEGPLSLTYNSDTVAPRPVVQAMFHSDPNGPVPTQIQVTLTWNGVTQAPVVFQTTGHSPGDTYLLAAQVASPVTASGVYHWSLDVQAALPDGTVIDRPVSGDAGVVANGPADPYGTGWSVGGVDRLFAAPNGDVLDVSGSGGSRLFRPGAGNTFLSPPNDFGTLVRNGDGTYTYTAKDQGRSTFDSQGRLTQMTDPHGLSRTFAYDPSGRLTAVTDPDASSATFAYDGAGRLSTVDDTGNPAWTFTHDGSGNLTGATDPTGSPRTFGYDSSGRLTGDAWGARDTIYTYDSATGTLSGADAGGGMTLSVVAETTQGLQTNPARSAGQDVATTTDGLGRVTTHGYDSVGRVLREQDADGSTHSYQRDFAGQVTAETDPLGHLTRYSYQYGAGLGDLTQVTNPDGTTTQYQYDPKFHEVTRETDPLGRVTTSTYDPNTGDLLTTTDPLGNTTNQTWSDGLLQSVTDPLGRTTTYQYTSDRMVQVETDPLGDRTSYAYDAAGNRTSVTEATGTSYQRTTTYVYDGDRRVVKEIDALGGVTTTTYDAQGDVTSTTDPLGHVTTYAYDQRGDQTAVTEAAGTPAQRTTTNVYDAVGNLVETIDPLGHVTTDRYDALNRRTGETEAVGTPQQRTTTTVYDAEGNVVETIDPLGHVTTYAYDLRNRQTGVTEAAGTPVQRTTTTVYDAVGNVTETIDPLGHITAYTYDADDRQTSTTEAVGTPVQRTTTTVYDADGNVVEMIDPLGHVTTYTYDALDRRTGETDAVGTPQQRTTTTVYDAVGNVTQEVDPLGHVTTYQYDALDRQTQATDPLGRGTTTTYDADGNVTSVTDPRGITTSYGYDALNRRVSTTEAVGNPLQRTTTTVYDADDNVIETVDPSGRTTSYGFDTLNRQVTVTDPLGHTTTTVYDADDNVVETIDPLGFTTTYTYDALNRQTSVQTPSGGVTTTAYDADDNVVETIDPLGFQTRYRYDALNRQTQSIDPVGAVTTYQYDADDNRVALTDPDGNKTTFVYDALNRLVQETDPLGHSATFTYDANDRMTSATDRDGRRRVFSYDDADRLTGETWYDASGNVVNVVTYACDADDNTLTAGDDHGTYTMTYDVLNRVVTTQEPFGVSLSFAYDASDNRTAVYDSFGGVTTSVYDAADSLISRSFTGAGQTPLRFDMTYDARDELTGLTRYSDLAGTQAVTFTSYAYDGQGRITQISHNDGPLYSLLNLSYAYDLDDRLLTETLNGTTTSYTCDATGQLTADSTTTYAYDAAGNRNNNGQVIGPDNQLLSDGVWKYTYDNEGNLVQKVGISNGLTWTYAYDNLNRLVSAVETGAASQTVNYVYDVYGNRIEEDVTVGNGPTTVTRFAYDGSNAFAELDANNHLVTRRLYLDAVDSLVARIGSGGVVAWYLTDRLGSVRGLVDNTGALIDQVNYDGFGNVLTETNPSAGDRYKFTAREFDAATGLQYNRARFYDPATGRWDSQDPLGFDAGDANLYRYVRNDPTGRVDPTGLIKWDTLEYVKTVKDENAPKGYQTIDIYRVKTDKGNWVLFYTYPDTPSAYLCHAYTFGGVKQTVNKKELSFTPFADSVAQILEDEWVEVTDQSDIPNLVKQGKDVIAVFYNGPNKDDITHSVKVIKPVLDGAKKIDEDKTLVNSKNALGDLKKEVPLVEVLKDARKEGFPTKTVKYWRRK